MERFMPVNSSLKGAIAKAEDAIEGAGLILNDPLSSAQVMVFLLPRRKREGSLEI